MSADDRRRRHERLYEMMQRHDGELLDAVREPAVDKVDIARCLVDLAFEFIAEAAEVLGEGLAERAVTIADVLDETHSNLQSLASAVASGRADEEEQPPANTDLAALNAGADEEEQPPANTDLAALKARLLGARAGNEGTQ